MIEARPDLKAVLGDKLGTVLQLTVCAWNGEGVGGENEKRKGVGGEDGEGVGGEDSSPTRDPNYNASYDAGPCRPSRDHTLPATLSPTPSLVLVGNTHLFYHPLCSYLRLIQCDAIIHTMVRSCSC